MNIETNFSVCEPFKKVNESVDFDIPENACDCHAHVFDDISELTENRIYTPSSAPLSSYQHLLSTLKLKRGVIVQPSVYGTDNRSTLEAVSKSSGNFRAVVVVDENITYEELLEFHEQGARGIRINVLFSGESTKDKLTKLAKLIAKVNWHMQLLIDVSIFDDFENFFSNFPVPIVIDHMGHVSSEKGVDDLGFQSLLRLMKTGNTWVKLSGSYRTTNQKEAPYDDITPFAQALVEANPNRCVWASDWPHPHIPVDMPCDADLLSMLKTWVPNQETRNKILVDNPAKLYGF